MNDLVDDWNLEDDDDFARVDRYPNPYGIGSHKINIDPEVIYDMAEQGYNKVEMGEELGISQPTLRNRIREIQAEQGLILQYRALQSLQLTSIQAKVLEAISPEKIEEAPLRDLVFAYKVLKDKELIVDGKPNEIKGLVGYLIQLEKEDAAVGDTVELDVTPEDNQYTEDGEKLPNI